MERTTLPDTPADCATVFDRFSIRLSFPTSRGARMYASDSGSGSAALAFNAMFEMGAEYAPREAMATTAPRTYTNFMFEC